MRHRILFTAVLSGVLGAACSRDATEPIPPPTADQVVQQGTNRIPNQYIVVLKPSVRDIPGTAQAIAQAHGGTIVFTYTHALRGFLIRLPDAAAAGLAHNPFVEYVEQDQLVQLDQGPVIQSAEVQQPGATWGIDRVDQRDLPLDANYFYSNTGTGVKVYIIDTGIRLTHDEFENADGTSRAITGHDFVTSGGDGSPNACPPNSVFAGHGTHVAGTAGGKTLGVAKGVTLVTVRVFDCNGNASKGTAIAGVNWVTGDHQAGQPAVANASFGYPRQNTPPCSGFPPICIGPDLLNQAVENSISDGVSYAVSAGNDNQNACFKAPASAANPMTVAASDINDARASFSNFGQCVDLFAPGVNITSAGWLSDAATALMSGTSMASPHVAGAMALYLQVNPGATPAAVRTALANQVTLNKITNAGSDSPNRLLYTRWIGGGVTNPQGVVAQSSALGNGPFALDISSADVVYVTRQNAATMQRVNLPSYSFSGVVTVGSIPTQVAFNPAGTTAWVTNQFSHNVGVVDVATNTQVRTIPVPGDPFEVLTSANGATLYVSSNDQNVYAIDAGTEQIIATMSLGGQITNNLVRHPDGIRIYGSQRAGGTIKEIDTQTNTVLRTFTIPGASRLQGMAVSANGTELYVADEVANKLWFVRIADGAVITSVPLGGAGFDVALSPDNARLYVSLLTNTVQVIGRASQSVVQTITIANSQPRRLGFSVRGETVVIADLAGKVHFVR